jgi:hypothetical protein
MSLARNPARQLLAQASSSLRAPRSAARVAVAGARLPRATRLVAPMSTSAPRRLADAKGTPAEESAESKESAVGKGLGIKETPDAKGAAAAPAEHEAKLKEKDAKIKELQVSRARGEERGAAMASWRSSSGPVHAAVTAVTQNDFGTARLGSSAPCSRGTSSRRCLITCSAKVLIARRRACT